MFGSILLWGAAYSSPRASYISSPWEDYVLRADFVGIVECRVAGGVVAKYRIVESWKGPPQGGEISIRAETSRTGDHFPLTLVGERYLAILHRPSPNFLKEKPSSRGSEPLWWRQIPYDYEFLGFPGRVLLPVQEEGGLWGINSPHQDVVSFKKAAMILINMNEDEQEAYFLHEVSTKGWNSRDDLLTPKPPKNLSARTEVLRLLQEARKGSDEERERVCEVLSYAGGRVALVMLRAMAAPESPFPPERLRDTIRWIESALGQKDEDRDQDEQGPPSVEALAGARKTLADPASKPLGEAADALDLLTVYDPAMAVGVLTTWGGATGGLNPSQANYSVGSYFGFRCGSDCTSHLKTLLEAENPIIRTSAAIYLSLRDPDAGLPALRSLLALPDDAGAWAAIALMSRGERAAIPRALELLHPRPEHDMDDEFHRNLRGRLFVLLSNGATESGLRPPASPRKLLDAESSGEGREKAGRMIGELYQEYLEWLDANHEELVMTDPWFPELERQGID
jgi:hypothetical protein